MRRYFLPRFSVGSRAGMLCSVVSESDRAWLLLASAALRCRGSCSERQLIFTGIVDTLREVKGSTKYTRPRGRWKGNRALPNTLRRGIETDDVRRSVSKARILP